MSSPQEPGQYPGWQPGNREQGQPQAGYPAAPPSPAYTSYQGANDPAPRASGGTAITAAVLAILGGLWAIFMATGNFSTLDEAPDAIAWIVVMQGSAGVLEILTLLPGAVLLLLRKPIGRWLVVVGCVLHILQGVVAAVVILGAVSGQAEGSGATLAGFGAIGLIIVLLPAIATLVLALLPLTARWIEQSKRPAQQQAPGYPSQGQYPQQGGYPQQGQYPPQQGGYPQQGQYPPQY